MPIRVFTAFEEVPIELRRFLSHPQQQNFSLSFDWFKLLFDTSLKGSLSPRIYVLCDDAGQPLCALFCGVERGRGARSLISLGNFYTQEYSPSFTQGVVDRPAIVGELVRFLAAERPHWDCVHLRMLSAQSPDIALLADALRTAGFFTQTYFQYENHYLRCAGESFETYFSRRPSQLRNTISRRQKKLEKAHKYEVALTRGSAPGWQRMTQDFVKVYQASWKQPEPFADFIPALVGQCAALGALRLGVLYVDSQPAAAQLWITCAGKALIYKLAYDEKYSEFGVGSILSKELFRVAIDEDRVEEIDYGVGSEPYKKDWMSAVRQIEGLVAYNRSTVRGWLMSLTAATAQQLKKVRALVTPNPVSAEPASPRSRP